MGAVMVPETAYWGPQTQRAVENFPVSGERFSRAFIRALGLVKIAAARVNRELGLLDSQLANAIEQGANEAADGKLDDHFVVDVFQTGSGTSTNMNANEVIANRANELLGYERGRKSPVHPNDHVNKGQSSNDVIPTAIHVAAVEQTVRLLLPALGNLVAELKAKSDDFSQITKIGRTHLQDATPVSLGQEFGGYSAMIDKGVKRVEGGLANLSELAIGGTAVGTGINTHPEFGSRMSVELTRLTGLEFTEAADHFEAQAARDGAVEMSGALKTVAISLYKIANDIRFLGSGPRCGLGEIRLTELQPGSSIMPGKVNPVIPEVVMQVAAQVVGNDAAITVGGLSGNFELNVMKPLIARNLLQSINLLSSVSELFAAKCISGIEADIEGCNSKVEQSLALVTSLVPRIGYDAAAEIAKEAYRSGRTVRQVVLEQGIIPEEELNRLLAST